MLRWKSFKLDTIAQGGSTFKDALAGMSGKNRVIKYLLADANAGVNVRVYRDADLIVDLESTFLTLATTPALALYLMMDLPLAEGQLCSIGFYGLTGGATTPDIAIGYEETS